MGKAFLDVNVLIDLLEKRDPFYSEAIKLIQSKNDFYISPISIHIVWYVTKTRSMKVLEDLTHKFLLIDLTEKVIWNALKLGLVDFEDSIQIASFTGNCDYFITRDKKLIKQFKGLLPILTPKEFLEIKD